jgi:ATP-dependent Clp protease protease subunit
MEIKIFGEVGGLGFDVDKIVSQIQSAQDKITIHMMSVGGTAIYGLSIFDALKASAQETEAYIYGYAYSAGSVICAGCEKVYMSDVGSLMIHEVHGASEEINNFLTQRAINAYHIKTGLEKEEIAKMLQDETFLNADRALELGFIDEKMDFKQAVAFADLFDIENKTEVKTMSEDKVQAVEDAAKNEAVEVAEVAQPAEEAKQEIAEPKQEIKTEEVEQAEQKAEPVKAEADANSTLESYMKAFGDAEGARMFVQGVSFEAAQQKHISGLNDRISELEAENAKQAAIIEAGKKEIGGDALALGAAEPKASFKSFVRFSDK